MSRRTSSRRGARDRGAAAVEFALVFPLLLLIVFGIIDFGRALNTQITLTQAAREGAALDAVGDAQGTVITGTQNAATGLNPVSVDVVTCPAGVDPSANATVTVTYQFSFITPISAIAGLIGNPGGLGNPLTMTAQGVEPCES
jgi:Flp pilus assembly protein TadG